MHTRSSQRHGPDHNGSVRPFAQVIGDWTALADKSDDRGDPSLAGLYALAQTTPAEGLRAAFSDMASGMTGNGLVPQALAASIHNGLGRMQLLMGDHDAARRHFAISLSLMFEDTAISPAEIEARRVEQCRQLGIAAGWTPYDESRGDHSTEAAFRDLARLAPGDPFVTLALAERAQWKADFRTAIQHWQDLAGRQGASMPQAWYDRLAEAYVALGSFPPGHPDEEMLRGEIDKHKGLKLIHQVLQPQLYLEIGVQSGRSLRLATGPAIGIDPMPILGAPLPDTARLFRMSSDAFFANEAEFCLQTPPDLVFIDGMHLFEFVLRDFINAEKFAGPTTLVVIDDIFPNHPAQAARVRRTQVWTGDVWKLHHVLKTRRPDLQLEAIDAHPTGLLVIHRLDPGNTVLSDQYEQILAAFPDEGEVPQDTLERTDAGIASLPDLEARLRAIARTAADRSQQLAEST